MIVLFGGMVSQLTPLIVMVYGSLPPLCWTIPYFFGHHPQLHHPQWWPLKSSAYCSISSPSSCSHVSSITKWWTSPFSCTLGIMRILGQWKLLPLISLEESLCPMWSAPAMEEASLLSQLWQIRGLIHWSFFPFHTPVALAVFWDWLAPCVNCGRLWRMNGFWALINCSP